MSSQSVLFLLVEDDDLDTEAFRRALRRQHIEADLMLARDGAEALTKLRELALSGNHEFPLVFLDLNMPGMNGHEFLKELRADTALRQTIVFVLTSSDHERDIQMAYEKNVAGYFLKHEIHSCLTTISHYVRSTKLPTAPAAGHGEHAREVPRSFLSALGKQ